MHDVMYQRSSAYGKTLKNSFKFDGGSKAGFWYSNNTYSIRSSVTVPNALRIRRVNVSCFSLATNVNPGGSGSVSINTAANCGQGQYQPGTTVQLTANASGGYAFSNWSGDASGSNNPTSVTMNGNKSVTANFIGVPPPAPSLSSPPNGQGFRSCDNVTLDWNDAPGASDYLAQLATDSSFNSIIADSGWRSNSDWNIGGHPPGTYYWRAQARNQWGTSGWSETRSFNINANQTPGTPTQSAPDDGAWVNSRTPSLQWNAPSDDGCPRGLTYNAQIESVTGGAWSASVNDYNGTSWSPTVLTDDDFRWRIQAYDGMLLVLNSLLLMGITIMPFSTSLVVEYVRYPAEQIAALVYSSTCVGIAICFNLLWRYAAHKDRLLGEGTDRQSVESISRQYAYGPLLYLIAFGLAFVWVGASLAIITGLAIFFAIPGRRSAS